MLKSRLIEKKMLILLRQGKISKWFSGIGQEAISVGVTLALKADEYILPMHRNLGIFTTREIPLYRLFSQWQGKANGFTKGRDRSFHFGTQDYKIIGMISHLGPQLGVADGIALSHVLKNESKVLVKAIFMMHLMWLLYGVYLSCFVLKIMDTGFQPQLTNNIIANLLPIGVLVMGWNHM